MDLKIESMNQLISIIITCYNSEDCIIKSINSVLNQTYKNIHLYIYDDCSSDNTPDIIKKIAEKNKNKITFYISKTNSGGPATGRNWGINQSDGNYICFLDADDFWYKNKLFEQISFIDSHNFQICSSNSSKEHGNYYPTLSGEYTLKQMILRNRIILSSVMIDNVFLKKHNIKFNINKDYSGVEDYDFFLKLMIFKGRLFVLKNELICYVVTNNSLSHNDINKNEEKRLMVLYNSKFKHISDKITSLITILYYKYVRL